MARLASARKPWPLGALNDGEWAYIRREGDVREELFHARDDARQEHDLARDPTERSRIERMKKLLNDLTAGPLLPDRFSR